MKNITTEELKKIRSHVRSLKTEVDESWLSAWSDLVDYFSPFRGRFLEGEGTESRNDGTRDSSKLINSTPADAVRTIAAGLHGGLTSPSRPWFALSLPGDKKVEFGPARSWLNEVRRVMLAVMSRSNFYEAVHSVYYELAVSGTAAMRIDEDFDKVIKCVPYTIGEFFASGGREGEVDTLARRYVMTAKQIKKQFEEDKIPREIKELKNEESEYVVYHVIYPLENDPMYQYGSLYFLDNGKEGEYLRHAGYRSRPFVVARWSVSGSDVYGNGPGNLALGDAKMLQMMEKKKLKALDKMVDPPMNAPTSAKGEALTLIAGAVNFVDAMNAQSDFRPTLSLRPDMQNMAFEIDRVEARIKRAFYNDLFLSFLLTTKRMTATEVSERHDEKMLMLGPVLERLQSELFNVIIDRVFEICQSFDLLPEPPPEIQGKNIKVEYISTLAQAQKLLSTTSIEQFAAFVGSLTAVVPDVIDKVDFDETIDQYGDALGVPPSIIRGDEQVQAMRAEKAQAAQQQEAMQNAMVAAQGAKTLSDAKMGEENALDALTRSV